MFKTFTQGPRYKFKDQLFWAEGGVVCLENQCTGDFKAITRAEAAARAYALNAELHYCTYPNERDELCKCVVDLCETIKEAKRQGDPTDPEVRKQLVKDKRKISVLMSPGPSSVSRLGHGTLISQPKIFLMSDRFRNLKI